MMSLQAGSRSWSRVTLLALKCWSRQSDGFLHPSWAMGIGPRFTSCRFRWHDFVLGGLASLYSLTSEQRKAPTGLSKYIVLMIL